MQPDNRVKRPSLERTKPIRSFRLSAAADDAARHASPTAGYETATGPVARAVEMGYRVIDEYIRQGQSAARRFNEGGLNFGSFTSNWQEGATRIAQLTADWMSIWFELAQRAASGGFMWPNAGASASPSAPPAGVTTAEAPSPVSAPARVRIDIASTRPVEVSLDLRPEYARAPLVVHSLRAIDAALPRVTGVAFTPAQREDAAVLSVRIPAAHPAGTYSGAIVDATSNRPVGTLSVRIAD